mgnify:CR=1 FL=1
MTHRTECDDVFRTIATTKRLRNYVAPLGHSLASATPAHDRRFGPVTPHFCFADNAFPMINGLLQPLELCQREFFLDFNHISPPNLDQESSLFQDQDSVLELYQDQDLDIAHMFDH